MQFNNYSIKCIGGSKMDLVIFRSFQKSIAVHSSARTIGMPDLKFEQNNFVVAYTYISEFLLN